MNLPADSQAAFIVCTFSMLAKLALADGEVSDVERQKIERYMEERLRLDARTKKLALRVFEEGLQSPLEMRDYAEAFQRAFPEMVQRLEDMLRILVELSGADGHLSVNEDRLLRSTALLLGLTEGNYDRIRRETTGMIVH